jgi:hypothetical protein
VTALPPEVRRAAEPFGVGGFEIGYVTDDGLEHRVSLSQAWATPFESCSPIRRFTSHKGQRHLSGLWWSATTGGHVGFQSWMERDHVMASSATPTTSSHRDPRLAGISEVLRRSPRHPAGVQRLSSTLVMKSIVENRPPTTVKGAERIAALSARTCNSATRQMAGDIRGRSAILRPGSIVVARKASGSSRTTCSDATSTCTP